MKFVSAQEIYREAGSRKGLPAWTYNNDELTQLEIYQIYPTGNQKSVMAGVTYALPDKRPEMHKARELNRDINMDVGNEDIRLIKWAAEGMRSSAFDGVLLSDLELGIGSFQNRLREVLPVVTLDQEPEAGSLKVVNERLRSQANVAAVG